MPKENAEPEDVERIQMPNEETVKVDLEDDDDETGEEERAAAGDDDKDPAARGAKDKDGQPRDPKGRWSEKKAQRAAEHRARENWRSEKEGLLRNMSDMETRFTRQIEEMRAAGQRQVQQGQVDPHTAKLADIHAQLDAELKLIETDPNRGYKRYNDLQEAKTQAIIDRSLAKDREERQAQQRAQPQDPYAARQPFIESEFPWIRQAQYKALATKARAYTNYLIEVEGRPDTIDTDRESLAHIEATYGPQFGLARAPARPSAATRERYAQTPAHRTGPDSRPRPRSIELPAELVGSTGLSAQALRDALREDG